MGEKSFQNHNWCSIEGKTVIRRNIRAGRIKQFAAVLVMMCGLTLAGCANTEDIMPEASAFPERNDAGTEDDISILPEIVNAGTGDGTSELPEIMNEAAEDGESDPTEIMDSHVSDEVVPMVMVGGKVYYATGEESTIQYRCGMMDGEITSTVGSQEIPAENNQSNFGSGYGYQYGLEGTIEVRMDGKWYVYAEENNS